MAALRTYPSLSDTDVLRIAHRILSLLHDDMEQLVEAKVATAIMPLKKEVVELKINLIGDVRQVISSDDSFEQ